MYRFIEKPNLPEGRVRLVLAGERYLDTLRLDQFGIDAIGLPPVLDLEPPVASHADMQAVHLYKDKILSGMVKSCKGEMHYMSYRQSLYCKVKKLVDMEPADFHGATPLVRQYPTCAAYNVLLLGKLAVFNPKCIDSVLKSMLFSLQIQPVYVRQGFARCSVCIVNENAVITADTGIANALQERGVAVLRIRPGYIDLPGYDTGFIGGASFKISKNVLAFTGRLDNHPDWNEIRMFIKAHQVDYIFLSERPVFDMGTAIPIIEDV